MRFGAGALLIHDGCVLLGRRSARETDPLTWSCFGGKSEPGEDGVDCMIREVFEETGIRVLRPAAKLLHTRGRFNAFEFHTFAVFLDEAPEPTLDDETQEAGWFTLGSTPATLWNRMPRPMHVGLAELSARAEAAFLLHRWIADARAAASPRRSPAP